MIGFKQDGVVLAHIDPAMIATVIKVQNRVVPKLAALRLVVDTIKPCLNMHQFYFFFMSFGEDERTFAVVPKLAALRLAVDTIKSCLNMHQFYFFFMSFGEDERTFAVVPKLAALRLAVDTIKPCLNMHQL
ncbi:uncharacterized protein G2W53_039545 [Senna tora]|uniref:Uncharacterized protein n=1 Tax=Senna tora TaxID=362788 RepID=A0A834SNT2_9FABA|nr:uncharacterized protein G2W53_039545 [Senna tora]